MSLVHSAHDGDVLNALDGALRAQVRRDGVDPQLETQAVRRLAERLVREHDQLSLTGAVLPVSDPEEIVDALVANVAGFGPLQPYLEDPEVEEIWINDPAAAPVQVTGS